MLSVQFPLTPIPVPPVGVGLLNAWHSPRIGKGRDWGIRNFYMPRLLLLVLAMFLAIGGLSDARPLAAQVQPMPPTSTPDVIPLPHLGYGIHVAPDAPPAPALIDSLGFDWVKIYDLKQVAQYSGKRLLYRIDFKWPTDWTAFRADVISRARELIGQPIDAIEVGNEPNLINEWNSTPNAWQYTQMLRVVYTEFKAVNPTIIIVSGGLAPTLTTADHGAISDLDFAKEMLDNGAGQWLDAFGYHPYGYNQAPEADPTKSELVFRRTERIRALMENHGVYKQIWLTEFGWLRNPAEDGTTCSDTDPDFAGFAWLRVSGQTQADYLARAYQYADQHWAWAGPMFVWNLNWSQLASVHGCSHMRWFSLLHSSGAPTPALAALQGLTKRYSLYSPHLDVHLDPASLALTATASLHCLRRTLLGTFTVGNSGYPVPTQLQIKPVNGPNPPFAEITAQNPSIDVPISIFVNPAGVTQAGQYPIYISIRAQAAGRVFSQTVSGKLIVSDNNVSC